MFVTAQHFILSLARPPWTEQKNKAEQKTFVSCQILSTTISFSSPNSIKPNSPTWSVVGVYSTVISTLFFRNLIHDLCLTPF